jgi:hypothetical protein
MKHAVLAAMVMMVALFAGTSMVKADAPASAPVEKFASPDEALMKMMSLMDEMLGVTAGITDLDSAKAVLPKLKDYKARVEAVIDAADSQFTSEQMDKAQEAHKAEGEAMQKRLEAEDARLKSIGVDLKKLMNGDTDETK